MGDGSWSSRRTDGLLIGETGGEVRLNADAGRGLVFGKHRQSHGSLVSKSPVDGVLNLGGRLAELPGSRGVYAVDDILRLRVDPWPFARLMTLLKILAAPLGPCWTAVLQRTSFKARECLVMSTPVSS